MPRLPPRGWGFRDIGPEYWISTGDELDVAAGDVTQFDGVEMSTEGDDGDVGFLDLFRLDVKAHLWYFGPISACDRRNGGDLFA